MNPTTVHCVSSAKDSNSADEKAIKESSSIASAKKEKILTQETKVQQKEVTDGSVARISNTDQEISSSHHGQIVLNKK